MIPSLRLSHYQARNLLLISSRCIFSLSLLGQSLTIQFGIITCSTQGVVSTECFHLFSNRSKCDSWGRNIWRNSWSSDLSCRCQLFRRGVTILGFTSLSWEDNKTWFVFFQALGIELKRLNTFIGSSMINWNTNGASKLNRNTSFLWIQMRSKESGTNTFSSSKVNPRPALTRVLY